MLKTHCPYSELRTLILYIDNLFQLFFMTDVMTSTYYLLIKQVFSDLRSVHTKNNYYKGNDN